MNTSIQAQKFLAEKEAQGRLFIYHVLEEHAQKQPNRLFLEYDGRSWTYKDFFSSLHRVGNWLINDLGIQAGEMIAIDGPNSAEYLMLWFALEAIGAAVAFINSNLTGASLTHCVKASRSWSILSNSELTSMLVERNTVPHCRTRH